MNYIKEIDEYEAPVPELVYCVNCNNIMSFRVVEELHTYFNWSERDKMYHKHVDGVYLKRHYECLECGKEFTNEEAKQRAMNR